MKLQCIRWMPSMSALRSSWADTPTGDVNPDADSDPYRAPSEDDEQDRASGTRGSGHGAEDR